MVLPNLPDNLYKIVFAVSLAAVYLFGSERLDLTRKYDKIVLAYNDSLNKSNDEISEKESIIMSIDSSTKIFLNRAEKLILIARDKPNDKTINERGTELLDSFNYYQAQTNTLRNEVNIINKKIKKFKEKTDNELELISDEIKSATTGILIFVFILGITFSSLLSKQFVLDEILKRELHSKPKYYSNCQSCGKKFSSMCINGTNKDNTKNQAFCNSCFDIGKFKEPELTLSELIIRVDTELTSIGETKSKKKIIEGLKELERWKKNKYK